MIALALLLALQAPPFATLAGQAGTARAQGSADAPVLYQRALKVKPDWKDGWWALGTLHYGKNQFAEATAAFDKLVALDKGSAPAYAMLGLSQYNLLRYDAALENLAAAQKLNVMNESIGQASMYTLAKLWTKRGNFEGALGILYEFAQLGKESPAFLLLSGTAGLWKPMFPEEVPAADRDLVFLAGKAFWEASKRNVPVARASFDDLLAHYPTAPGVHYLYGSFEMYDNVDRAVTLFEEELKLTPDHIGAQMALGAEHLRRGEAAKALPYAQRSVELAPASYASHTLLGRALLESGELQSALKELEAARQMAPDDPQPRIALASLYAKLGRKDDAARERREFLRIQAANKKPGEK